MKGLLQRIAAGAPVPVFPAVGPGFAARVDDLRLRGEIEVVDTPRHATVLLVAGPVPSACRQALAWVHDALPRPRVTVWWGEMPNDQDAAHHVAAGDEPVTAIVQVHRRLLEKRFDSERHWLPDEPPQPWRGRGDHGQGGEGMMGGVPYGRPMAHTAPDLRDGLELDSLAFRLGPFFPPLQHGAVLDVTLQGDVVQEIRLLRRPWPAAELDAFERLVHEPVGLADLERTRADHHLRALARALAVMGAPLAARSCRVAARQAARGGTFGSGALVRRLRRVVRAVPAGTGTLPDSVRDQLTGPAARAAGAADDLRSEDDAYRGLSFEPIVGCGGDLRARLEQWLREAEQAVELADRAGPRLVLESRERVERPAGVIGAAHPAPDLVRAAVGLEWQSAVATLASLDLQAAATCPNHDEEPDS